MATAVSSEPAGNEHSTNDDAEESTEGDDNSSRSSSISGSELAKKETKAVTTMRLGLFATLIVATLVVACSAYFVVNSKERSAFESAFDNSGLKIVEAFQSIAERKLGAIATFASMITSHALSSNSRWPLVTIPNMEAQAERIQSLAGSAKIAFAPIVEASDRLEWEDYTLNNGFDWVSESHSYLDTKQSHGNRNLYRFGRETLDESAEEKVGFSTGFSPRIYDMYNNSLAVVSGEGPWLPMWQRAPQTRNDSMAYINFDISIDSNFKGDGVLGVLQKRRAGVGRMTVDGYSATTGEDIGPISAFHYPILEGFDRESKVAGALATLFHWQTFFTNSVPSDSECFVVLDNSCNQSYTFEFDGASVKCLGEGDLHDKEYDAVGIHASFSALISRGIQSNTYLGFPFDDEGCEYNIHVFPSTEMEDKFRTNHPALITTGAVLIFLLTSLAFLVYDRLVERRQRLVLREAEDSGAIVSSLFPSAYRERLVESHNAQGQRSRKEVQAFLMRTSDEPAPEAASCAPIADLYPDCTVLFADLVVRPPTSGSTGVDRSGYRPVKKAGSGKGRSKKRTESYSSYIYKVLKQVHYELLYQ